MAEATNSDDRDDLVDRIADEFLQRLRRNENPSTAELAKEHPDLAPDLEKRLRLVESIFKSAESADSGKTKRIDSGQPSKVDQTERGSTVMGISGNAVARFACPHCGNRVQIVELVTKEVTCGSCGSSVKIARPAINAENKIALPKQLGRFTVKRILGEGAFGIVFLAWDPRLDRDVAIKTPRHGFFPTLDEERRFFREAKNAASLRHPNIVQVFEVCDDEGSPLIVSEYIDGLTLNDVANGNLLTFKETTKLMIQIANAVEYAHQNGVVHRDLKPSNILLDTDRNAYIADFGLAYRDDAEITMTLDGAVLGTPAYMSPEQAEGNQRLIGRRSDVYSLGVILYRLITKDLPFHGTKRMLVQQVINDDPKPPCALNDRIPRDLETITLKAMSKSPESRYQSAGEMAEELQRYLMGEPILARPIGSFAKLARWCVRRPAIASLSGSIAVLLLLCAAISASFAITANRLTRDAIENGALATKNGQESLERLHDLLMSNGVTELKLNNLTTSSVWFSEALAIKDSSIDRTRVAMIQDRLPKLTHLVDGFGPCNTAFSADGSRYVTASNTRFRVFETQTHKSIFDEQLNVFDFRFAHDGTKVAIAAESAEFKSISLWDVDKRRMTATLEHSDAIQSFEFDSNSTKLVSGSFDGTAKVWKVSDGSVLAQHKFDGFRIARITFIVGTDFAAVELNRNDELGRKFVIWDFVQDALVGKEMLHDSFVKHIRVSADGKRICTGEAAGAIKVWEVASGNQIGETIVTNKGLLDAQFTANDESVIGVFANGEVSIFDYRNGTLLSHLIRPTKFNLLTQSPDSSILALGSVEGKVVFIWRETLSEVCTPVNNGPDIRSIVFHPDGRRVVVASSCGALQFWDLAASCPSSFLFQHEGTVTNAFFVPKTDRCVTVSFDGKGYIWDGTTGQRIGEAFEHKEGIGCASAASSGEFLVSGGSDKLVKVWDSLTGKQIGSSYAHDKKIMTVRFTRDGSRVFAGDEGGTIRCWEVSAKAGVEPKPTFEMQQNAEILSLRLSPDESILASASKNGSIRLWNAKTGEPSPVQIKHGTKSLVFRFMPDGKRLITSGEDDPSTIIWELATGDSLAKLPTSSRLWDLQVVENGKRILTIHLNGTANVWQVDVKGSYNLERTFNLPPNAYALGAGFNEKASILTMGGGLLVLQPDEPQRGVISLWNFADGRPLGPTLRQKASFMYLTLSDDGQKLFTISDDNTARLWKISSTNLPPIDLQRISQLYAQQQPDSEGGLKPMRIETQVVEFEALKEKHPAYFTLDEDDDRQWEIEMQQNANSVK